MKERFAVTGVDPSPAMLAHATALNPECTFVLGDTTRGDLDVVFVESVFDPDPADEEYDTTILYLIRDHGRVRIENDHWTMGIFALDTWREVLREAGFEVHEGPYNAGEDEYTVLACVKTG